MSLAIQVDNVKKVLLADGWHKVYKDSFDLDSYEFMNGKICLHYGGHSDVCATGFWFNEDLGTNTYPIITGPLTSILAVRYDVK